MEGFISFWKKNVFNKIVVVFVALFTIGFIGSALEDNKSSDVNNQEKTKLESKKEITIIDFSNMPVREITVWCEENKVECYTKNEYSNFVEKGLFVSQSIDAGKKIYEKGEITIIYSLGKEPTLSQKNALKSAMSYLDYSSFSYTGLIKQLEFEKYPHEDAIYAVENCGADWNEQAYKKGESYLDYSSFSRQGLINQLKFEGFTDAQAKYAVDKIGL